MKILLATDGSKYSQSAIDECCRVIANQSGISAVKVVSVFENPAVIAGGEPFTLSPEYYQEIEEAAQSQAEETAEKTAEQIRQHFPQAAFDLTVCVEMGSPAKLIVEAAEDWHADLIVVGSHGRGFWGRTLLGSVSDTVVRHAPCSVLIVRSKKE